MTNVGHLDLAGTGPDFRPVTGEVPSVEPDHAGPCGAKIFRAIVRKDVARNRARILAAADQLMADRGLDLSFNELAHRAGVGVGTVYRHFADRQAVIDALLETRLERVADILRAAAELDDPGEAFKTAVREVVRLQTRDRGVLACVTPDRISDEQHALVRAHLEPLVRRIVERAHAAGWLRPDVSVTDVPVIFSLIDTIAHQTEKVSPDLWPRYLDLLLDGMSTPNPSPLAGTAPTIQTLEALGRLKGHRGRAAVDTIN